MGAEAAPSTTDRPMSMLTLTSCPLRRQCALALALFALVVVGPCAAGAETLLVLVDRTLLAPLAGPLGAWTNQIAAEGRYQVRLVPCPRAGAESKRLANLARLRAEIEETQPAAVQIIGHLDYGITGWGNPDGHEARAHVTDAHLMARRFVGTDTVAFGAAGSRPNQPGDGRWDQQGFGDFGRPVARIDLGGLTGSMVTVPAYQYRSGCLKGQPYCPAIDEVAALTDYFRRNLDYRQRRWVPPRVGCMVGPLWDVVPGQAAFTLTNMPQVAWQRGPSGVAAAGKEMLFLWCTAATTELSEYRREPDCAMVRPLWVNTYRSYGMEVLEPCGTMRRWLQWALVSTWGPRWWVVPPDARTVGDAIARTAAIQRRWDLLYQVMGDLTLPLAPAAPAGSEQSGYGEPAIR
jgi:hypothetical protein